MTPPEAVASTPIGKQTVVAERSVRPQAVTPVMAMAPRPLVGQGWSFQNLVLEPLGFHRGKHEPGQRPRILQRQFYLRQVMALTWKVKMRKKKKSSQK